MNNDVVLDVQNALRILHFCDARIPPVFPNGFYDILTQEAVKIYQQTRGLEESGTIDPLTFHTLMDETANTRSDTILPLPVFAQSNIRLEKGNRDDAVWFVQAALNTIASFYQNIPYVSLTGEYDANTESAIKAIQAATQREITGILDTDTWNNLVRLFQTRPLLGSVEL